MFPYVTSYICENNFMFFAGIRGAQSLHREGNMSGEALYSRSNAAYITLPVASRFLGEAHRSSCPHLLKYICLYGALRTGSLMEMVSLMAVFHLCVGDSSHTRGRKA